MENIKIDDTVKDEPKSEVIDEVSEMPPKSEIVPNAVEEPSPATASVTPPSTETSVVVEPKPEAVVSAADVEAVTNKIKISDHPNYSKYFKMLRLVSFKEP